MTTGILILCRYDSRRLPGKILRDLRGRSVLGHILDRVHQAVPGHPVVVATSARSCDDPIAEFCRRSAVPCFRGAAEDVAGRFLACAEELGWNHAVRINGDNLFVDPATLHAMVAIAETGVFDMVTNVPGRTFPYGMSVEIVGVPFYRAVLAGVSDPHHREHVTSWLYQNPDVGRRHIYINRTCPEAAGMHLALDTPEDLSRAAALLARLGDHPASVGLPRLHALLMQEPEPSPWQGESGPLLIAEIGGNHEGDFETAKAMTALAIESGADCVKFQIYRGATLVNPVESPDRYRHFQRFELEPAQHVALARMCTDAGVGYLSSVWDMEMLDLVEPYMPFYKIGSGDLTAWPLVRAFARRGKPILLSTGLATMDEVLQTVAQIQAVDARYRRPEWLCLLQCTSMYPIPDSDANLRVMDALRAATGVAVGYSDHTVGGAALRAAAAMGAEVLEFHFTDSREGKTFRDHFVSLTVGEVQELKRDLKQIRALRGHALKQPEASEVTQGHVESFRRAVYANRPLRAGETLTTADLTVLRPNHGTDARDFDRLIGLQAKRDIAAFRALTRGEDYDDSQNDWAPDDI
ncbi:N-acetylneuraminate synthase family protein [Blastochloris sulfoviridis]|uniref:AFP-like domain-containing protein n=1 Tax=Blastochloris sulfoviridis TaxID=50712 RepID=A0A5M6HMS4_9HYPH|nr:N-acetylneuraminate synthase family protein [Blastochloris sulfoviridis]KAA5597160.1 hypothetical protein F1193_15050 [Blastochloris sulfoviridis]